MSQEDIKIQHEWNFQSLNCTGTTISVYSNSFDTRLIAGVKIEIFSGILNRNECIVVLSKKPYIPANVTIKIQSRDLYGTEHIYYQNHANRWIDNWTVKFKFHPRHRNYLFNNDNLRYEVCARYQCDITWHGYDESERDVIYSSLKHFLTAPDFSDMVIVIGEKEIPVHKIILAAYSPVFLAMFKANMTESVDKRIVVTDIEVDVMEKVIDYMYTGVIHLQVPDIDVLISILKVADKYEIMTLKKLCEQKLSEKIKIENVLEILDRTSLYQVPQLRQTITSFMIKNKSSIVGLKGFADLHNRKPELLFEFVMTGIAPH
ncbi:hypothetical protein PV325_007827 [Microctonus aethiopoides]|nr:hypothetical protein PV325_007827 [Microctonus aethiopoides]